MLHFLFQCYYKNWVTKLTLGPLFWQTWPHLFDGSHEHPSTQQTHTHSLFKILGHAHTKLQVQVCHTQSFGDCCATLV